MAAEPSTYKIVLLGDTGVGKSSVASQFVQGQFKDSTESTIGLLTWKIFRANRFTHFDLCLNRRCFIFGQEYHSK
jgi:GTPase SAR1 family protein